MMSGNIKLNIVEEIINNLELLDKEKGKIDNEEDKYILTENEEDVILPGNSDNDMNNENEGIKNYIG